MTTEADLWRFSLQIYSAPGVQQECLQLQERCGADVNLVLFCAYLGVARGITLTPRDLAAAREVVSSWHVNVVKPARALRRTLKDLQGASGADLVPEIEALRNSVKRAELDSERLEQKLLAQWADQAAMKPDGESAAAAAERNVLAYLRDIAGAGTPAAEAPQALLHAAADFVAGKH